jgi:hypothetical protein
VEKFVVVIWRSIAANGARARFLAVALIVYATLLVASDFLRFPIRLDEVHFWPTTLWFFADGLPSVERLRNYPGALNTPLPFLITGSLEYFFHGGISVARGLNFALSFALFVSIGALGRFSLRAFLCAAGLALCPYFFLVSLHDYTDMIPVAFIAAAIVLYFSDQHWWCALCCALAIASRQYAVAFPAAIFGYELLLRLSGQVRGSVAPLLAPLLASLSLLGWFFLFGGMAPQTEMTQQGIVVSRWFPDHVLYFLSCVGFYFVFIELILFRSLQEIQRTPYRVAATVILVCIAFWSFPPISNPAEYPIPTMGYLDRGLRFVAAGPVRIASLCAFAILACLRFQLFSLGSILLAANALTMIKAPLAWDKYALPLLAILWLMKAAGWLEMANVPQLRRILARATGSRGPPISSVK